MFKSNLLKVFLVSFLFGFFIWSLVLRTVIDVDARGQRFLFVLISPVSVGEDIVFRYPKVTSPYAQAKVEEKQQGSVTVKISGTKVKIPEELVLGRIIFSL